MAATPRRMVAVAAAVVVLAVGGAASCGPKNKPQGDGDDVPRASAVPEATAVRGSFERHSELVVAGGLRPQTMQFHDAYTGYLLLTGCAAGCLGALFITYDGGFSWVERTLPFQRVEAVNLWLVGAKTIVLSARPAGWFRSTDAGHTFVRGGDGDPPPSEYRRGPGIGCVEETQDCPRVFLLDGRPAPVQPPLAGSLRGVEQVRDGRMFAVASEGATVTTAMSGDGGRTWTPVGGPLPVPGTDSVALSASPDGRDVWLVTAAGEKLAAYLLEPAGWREVRRDLEVGPRAGGGVAIGLGTFAVPGGRFSYLFANGRYSPANRPSSATSVQVLSDGTLMTSTSSADVWLGVGDGAARAWSRITVDPVWR